MCLGRASVVSQDLVKSLCKHDPSERLPMKKGGSRNVKSPLGRTPGSERFLNWAP